MIARNTICCLIALSIMTIPATCADSPGKKSRSLTTDAQIRMIRENIAKYPKAREIADKIIKSADEWVARSDREVWELVPAPDIPRAFNSSFEGCPVHGMEYFKHGNYSWKMDPFNNPWKIACPVGGEEYPSNDFMAYYKTKDRSLLIGDYPDDGWGWLKPGDEKKHWFVAYYCHWLWQKYIVPGVENLSLAYVFTGDEKYARKAIVMLDRIADFYPEMDHNKQSRYAQEFAPAYTGKIVNKIWETGLVSNLTSAYDSVFDVLKSDGDFEALDGEDSPLAEKTNAEIRSNIEKNLLRVGVAGVYDGSIRGNFGMHQRTLLRLAITLQDEELKEKAVDYILNNSSGDLGVEGFNYAMDNFILREGVAFESAPGYCFGWSSSLAMVGELLDLIGVDIFDNPKFKRMFTAYMRLRVLDKFTPAIGDSGSVGPGAYNMTPYMARMAVDKFGDPEFAKYLLDREFYGEDSFASYLDLRLPVLEQTSLERMSRNSPDISSGTRNLGGYGLAVLESGSGEDAVAASVYYGPAEASHGHYDRLSMEVYAYGKKLVPDLGYPQFAAEHKDRPAWETNTISHYTVTVDASKQATRKKGHVNQFADTPDVKLLDVSAPDAYPHLDQYRRVTLMIGGESEFPYLVDFFIVEGGTSHDYSFHGFSAEFSTDGIRLVKQGQGTLAGENVPFSYLYDDPELEEPGKTRSFGSYRGSGYSYLYNVDRGRPEETWSALWQDGDIGLRAIFPSQEVQEVAIADGNPPRGPGRPESLKYILLRNSGDEGLKSRFACVLQPFRADAAPIRVKRIPARGADLLEIRGSHGIDYVCLATDPNTAVNVGGLTIEGKCAVIRMAPDHGMKSVFLADGTRIIQGQLDVECGGSVEGVVDSVNFAANEVALRIEPSAFPDGLTGHTILFGHANYPVHYTHSGNGKTVVGLAEDSPRTGKVVIESIGPEGTFVATPTLLYFERGGCYEDKWLVNENFTAFHKINSVGRGAVRLQAPGDLEADFKDFDGDGRITAYLYDVAPGEDFRMPSVTWAGRTSSGWRLESNRPAKIRLPDGTSLRKGY